MGQGERTDIALVKRARHGLGDSIDLLIDAGLAWDTKTAIQRARAFADSNIFWLEEPLRPDDYKGYRKLSEATPVRIAAGEEESNRYSYINLMDRGRIDVLQSIPHDVASCRSLITALPLTLMSLLLCIG